MAVAQVRPRLDSKVTWCPSMGERPQNGTPWPLSAFVWGEKLLEQFQDHFRHGDRYVQDTQAVRVIARPTGTTVDVIPLEDELAILEQDVHDESYFTAISPTPSVYRHCARHFTVARACAAHGAELLLMSQPFATIGQNNVWLAIYSSTTVEFMPPDSRTLIGVLGSRHGHQISYGYSTLCYFVAEDDIELVPGVNYWLAICAADPRVSPPVEEWDANAALWVAQAAMVGPMLIHNTNSEPYPSATATYDSMTETQIWCRLYAREYTLEDIPLAEGGGAPSIGVIGVLRRTGGMHHRLELMGGVGGIVSVGTPPGGIGGITAHNLLTGLQGGGDDEFYHFTEEHYRQLAATIGAAGFEAYQTHLYGTGATLSDLSTGAIIYAGAAGVLAGDVDNLYWDATNKRLGLGTPAVPHGGVGAAKFAMEGPNASAAGPHIQITTATDDYPLFQQLNYYHDGIFLGFDMYWDGEWRSSDVGSNLALWKYADKFQIRRDAGKAAGSALTLLDWLVVDLTQGKADMHAYPAAAEWALNVFSHDAVTNIRKSPVVATHQTTANMVDGFGAGITFQLLDAGLADNKVLALYAVRAGGDAVTDALLTFDPLGTPRDYFRLKSWGTLYLGHHVDVVHDTYASSHEALRLPGTTSDFVVAIQDGTSRVSMLWNADGANRYLVAGEAATKQLWNSGNVSFWGAAAGTAGAAVTWSELLSLERATRINFGQVPIRHAGGSVAMLVTHNGTPAAQAFNFTVAFPAGKVPTVVVCPNSNYSVSWRVHTISNTGFTIQLGATLAYTCTFGVVAFLPEGVVPY